MTPSLIHLNTLFGLIHLQGEGAKKLLQGQVTCDLEAITPQQGSLGALCNVKGRAICGFYLIQQDPDYFLILSKDLIEKTLTTLKKYAVFFPVTLTDASDQWQVYGTLETTPTAPGFLMISQTPLPSKTDTMVWQQHMITAGLTLLNVDTSEKFIPLELNYEKFGGISFKKGCYTGQEIIARLHYRGQSKQQLKVFSTENCTALDTRIIHNQAGEEAGEIVDFILNDGQLIGLALIRDDQCRGEPLYSPFLGRHGGLPLHLLNDRKGKNS